MKRRWKIVLGMLAVLALLLAVNTITTGSETKEAGATVEGGQILKLSRGDVQVTDSGEPAGKPAQPIVLIHPYAGSLHWFDRIEPLLAEDHRVIRIDLLGFGGSEKPEAGYGIDEQALVVAEALSELNVQGALVAGNSMGAMVTASVAEQASQLVDRAVVIDMAPNTEDFGDGLPFIATLGYQPVLGEAMWRTTPDFALRDGLAEAFAPGFEMDSGFPAPDQPVDDFRAMTFTSFDDAHAAADDYVAELPLDERFKRIPVPLLVIFGSEDQIFDAEASIEGYAGVPGVRSKVIDGAGHAPQVEDPEAVAKALEKFTVAPAPGAPKAKAKKKDKGAKAKQGAKRKQKGKQRAKGKKRNGKQ